ncbi:hypothetical protein OIV83_003770 [Microbotryomycetes sp. JL201]|nr:hypothetical protein OIV83_003770 [Microbotryomycetes sp. JL201]
MPAATLDDLADARTSYRAYLVCRQSFSRPNGAGRNLGLVLRPGVIALRSSTAEYQATAALLYLKRQLQLEAERHEAAIEDGEDALAASLEEDKGPQGADVRTSIPMIDNAWAVLSRQRRELNAERAKFYRHVAQEPRSATEPEDSQYLTATRDPRPQWQDRERRLKERQQDIEPKTPES